MASQIKLRRDTAANWTAANPVLGAGEPGYDTTNGKLKIGNGTTAWNSLAYFDDKVTDFSAVAADILPDTDNTRDLGSPAKQWRHVYMSGGSIYLDNIKLTNNDGKLEITKVINPGEENEAPDPVDSNAGDSVTSKLTNGEHTFELMDDGSLELDGEPYNPGGGGGPGLGNFTINGSELSADEMTIKTVDGDITLESDSDVFIDTSGGTKRWSFATDGNLTLPEGGDIRDSNGSSVLGGGAFNGTATAIELTGTIPYTNDNVLSTVVDFTRPNNSNNTVDAIDTGLTIKRGNNGGIYNSADNVETNWNSNQSPLGTEWNADGWGDLTDVQTRTYTTFYNACDQNIGSVVTHKEFVMHDTINDKYYKIKFHFWQPNNGGGAAQPLNGRSGFSYTRTLLDLSNGVYFVRGADDTNLGDEIGPGLTIKRDQAGGIYNSEVDAEWDPDNTPTGTLWNDDGWDDFTDITTRTWKPLYSAVHGQLGNHLVGAELLMHDTINDRYYTVKFTDWGQNNGGSFAYLRREIDPTGTRLGITFADGSVQKTATTLGDLRVVNGNVFENAVKSGHGAEIRYDVKNNFYYGTWAWTGTANWVASGNDGYIQFDNGDTNNSNQVDFRNFLNDLGRWHIKTVSINGGDPQTITNWSNNYIYTEDAPATDPTVVTEIRFYVTFRSRFYMGGEDTVGFFLNDRDENFQVQSRDFNVYAHDDVRIQGRDLVEIRNNATEDGVRIVANGDNSSKTWEFMPDGSLQLPNMDNTGWNWNYNLNGPTLKLGNNQDQTIITGDNPTQNYPSAQRLIIQGQRGYGTWGQNTAGEGGDVYIWGGVGGESDGGGGGGGDIKVRGGQGQNSDGGYVKIEGGSAAGWNNSPTGGYVEIRGGDAVEGGNGNGGDVRIFGGKKHGTGNNGEVHISTGANEEFEWKFDNGGILTLPSGNYLETTDVNLKIGSQGTVTIRTNAENGQTTKSWNFDTNGDLTLPEGGDIKDSTGNSVLGGGAVDTNIWIQSFVSDTPGDNIISANSVEYDPDGNVVALFSHDDINNSDRYLSVAKFDTSGSKLWQQRFAAGQYSDGWGLAADSTAIYVAGELDGTGSPAAYQVSSLMKLNTANGNVIWMKSFDFGEQSNSQVVDVASDGHPVIVGHAYSGGQAFITTTKVDKDTGNIIWSRRLDGQNGEYSYGMAVGPAGEIVVIGYMDNIGLLNRAATLYSDPVSNANWTSGTGVLVGGVGASVAFTDGVPAFSNIDDTQGDRSVDATVGVLPGTYFGGTTPADDMTVKVGTLLPGDSSDRMLVVKYDSAGFIQWQKAIQFDVGFDCSGADADIDSDGNIYVCGNYWKDNGAGGTTTAMSLLKMDGNGAKQWSRRVIGDCQDLATSVVVGPDNCLYLSGVTGTQSGSDYTFVIAKYSTSGSVLWQRLLDNTTTWTFGSNWFGGGGGSNIAVKNGYVAVSGTFGDPGPSPEIAFIAQVSGAGSLFTTGDWDFKGASFSGILNNTASDITVTDAGKTDSDNSINITSATQSPATDNSNFLIPTKYVLSTSLGDLTVQGNILKGTGTDWGSDGLYLAPGPNLAADMYFRVRGGDNATHLHFDTGDNSVYDQYFGDDGKYLKLGANGVISIETNSNTWTFGTDGNLALPGAVVNSTTPKTGGSGGTFTELDLTKSINKLTNGDYSLANGVEGQVMYLVMQDGATPSSIGVVVANFRIGGTVGSSGLLVPFKTFNDANVSYFDSRGFCTLIFTDGAWQQSGGSWN